MVFRMPVECFRVYEVPAGNCVWRIDRDHFGKFVERVGRDSVLKIFWGMDEAGWVTSVDVLTKVRFLGELFIACCAKYEQIRAKRFFLNRLNVGAESFDILMRGLLDDEKSMCVFFFFGDVFFWR